jgi:hypothetical protein
MKTPEDEAFDDLARRQGAWGGGYQAKRQAAMDKINSHFDAAYKKMHEDRATYSDIVSDGGLDPRNQFDAQPAQEPVSFPCCGHTDAIKWNQFNGVVQCHMCGQIYTASNAKQCFTTPPKREWVGLTDEEREQHRDDWLSNIHDKEFRAIEAKLKEKNG